jgi:hypothetical protein
MFMEYNKPEVAVLGSAAVVIEGNRQNIGDASSDLLQSVADCELDD